VARRFGGVTGDLAGWFLQVCELGLMLTLAIGGRYL
jgi:adenosylcobinamide-GDP ribazoletransferase